MPGKADLHKKVSSGVHIFTLKLQIDIHNMDVTDWLLQDLIKSLIMLEFMFDLHY